MKTVRRPPYPKWNPGYFPCSSLISLPLSSRRPSVSFGGFGLNHILKMVLSIVKFGGPNRHNTGIASPVCFDRLPSHISKMVVSTVNRGGPECTVLRTFRWDVAL